MTIDDRSAGGRRARPTARELRRYEDVFAARTSVMRSSAMRDMMALTERPEIISLAGGLPDTSTFPPERYARLMAAIAADSTARALQYGPTDGIAQTMDCVVDVMAAEGTYVAREDLILTTGGQQVIDLVCKTLIDPGDVIVAEAPTYPGAMPTFGAYQAEVVQIDVDSDGMPIDDLEATLDGLQAHRRRPKFIYTIPNFQNPGGVTMSLARRRRLVEVARERELLVLEDNPYGLLRYEGDPLPTLYSLDAATAGRGGASDFVMYLGTFSKILSPGLRLGWAVAPRPVLDKLNLGKQGADLCSSPVTQLFAAAYFSERDPASGEPAWLAYLESLRTLYKRRRDTMLEALEGHFGEQARWTRPQGGMFIWATLPDYIDTTDLLARALESEGVAFVPGRAAYVDGRGGSSMRLNFAGVREHDISEAIKRIGRVVRGQVKLFRTLTGAAIPAPARADDGEALEPSGGAAAEASGDVPAEASGGAPAEASADGPAEASSEPDTGLADVVELPRRQVREPGRWRSDR
jgi:2-aminoadipate transaminase